MEILKYINRTARLTTNETKHLYIYVLLVSLELTEDYKYIRRISWVIIRNVVECLGAWSRKNKKR